MRHVRMIRIAAAALLWVTVWLLSACENASEIVSDPQKIDRIERGVLLEKLVTDKAAYRPGEKVRFDLKLRSPASGGTIHIRYLHMDRIVEEETLKAQGEEMTWNWTPPKEDGRGYFAEVFYIKNEKPVDQMNIAVDVSSDWGKFPRYGYLADFPQMSNEERSRVIERLNRFHINGIQFYDWQYKHQEPIRFEDGRPAADWTDIAGRPVSFDTVKGYIDLAHSRGMKAMNYNLLFGAYEGAENDGVKKEWGMFKDPAHGEQDKHPLPDNWASDIYMYDPANPEWQNYLARKESETFRTLPFDGWHVDQLGDRGQLWTYEGNPVDLAWTYQAFLKAAKEKLNVDYVMNAVGQFGQEHIAREAPVKFLYTEVWGNHPGYQNLKEVIDQNSAYSGNRLNTVLAAYMNYHYSDSPGEFNTPGVLLTDAVIFASGGSHLELGENMLSKEYFPHKNLSISPALEAQLINYYDFLAAYQNLLRDGTVESGLQAEGTGELAISDRAEKGKVWSFSKRKGCKDIFHFINFTDASTMDWNDDQGSQTEPVERQDVSVSVRTDRPVAKVWFASPDVRDGSPQALEFTQQDGRLEWKLPKLKYWDMVVVEYEE
ncbi:dextranase [Paenibacillus sophorae]|uniref:Dextranase n=1 Tax=Paenibacillus sophorae TaxID=1333845 RepID=A0A1H8SCN8_9BACL|nr:glycoside hydrolase family 66 protein [Paenibacillus sophorae]QWU16768.1 glycoside hydrolase family 66 protein [Paenibacillus sophorae]SEO76490.1 dextranase [Paenibacillus sophorae]